MTEVLFNLTLKLDVIYRPNKMLLERGFKCARFFIPNWVCFVGSQTVTLHNGYFLSGRLLKDKFDQLNLDAIYYAKPLIN